MELDAVLKTFLENEKLKLIKRGKTKDVYELEENEHLLIIATDRMTVFDKIFPTPIPDKGKILSSLSGYWFRFIKENRLIETHYLTEDLSFYQEIPALRYDFLKKRSMIVKKTIPLPIKCIVRGYLRGSTWNEYQLSGKFCGIKLKTGLKESEKLPEPIFIPAVKFKRGERRNISFREMVDEIENWLKDLERKEVLKGKASRSLARSISRFLREISLQLYDIGARIAFKKGLIVADSEFEFGWEEEKERIILIDEVFTPDSSTFWLKETYQPGFPQINFESKFIIEWLEKIKWHQRLPLPQIPEDLVLKTRERYKEIYQIFTGSVL